MTRVAIAITRLVAVAITRLVAVAIMRHHLLQRDLRIFACVIVCVCVRVCA